ncbi:hypothetical protein OEB99_18060 [Actinotalea sp. M2MS4P-6]|uniref:vitamin K epoxide reductase family protein n=1 Tax=Actinotalea sp. M2MS4P-6 TaxID=2983762 RepID=UPI0021E4F12A|nr:vitamin K epoxide reductase family protein [Actinotalea sp. M2MS4P-6]MCV2396219.1 hypothetical protein [Actinotalea sp. M2MS4P-6]
MARTDLPRQTDLDRGPSDLRLRRRLALGAALGAVLATYLTLVQVGVAPAWDPVFGTTDEVLHSWVSQLFPVPDALLGAVLYTAEAVLALVGGPQRWRTAPWLVLTFEALLVATAGAGLALTAVQAFVLHAFCLLCLVQAGIGVTLLAASRLREARAALAHLRARGD